MATMVSSIENIEVVNCELRIISNTSKPSGRTT